MATATKEKRKIDRGNPVTELVKGSLNYTMHTIRRAFNRQFDTYDEDLWVDEIFDGYVIVASMGLAVDEYYMVTYTREDGEYLFTDRDQWEVVELTYQPQSGNGDEDVAESDVGDAGEAAGTQKSASGVRQRRFTERFPHAARLEEAKKGKPRVLKAKLAQAGVVNENGRRYPRAVVREAVQEARTHLHESLSQGRAILLGESEHPADKRQGPRFLETIVVWQDIWFDEGDEWVRGEGHIVETSIGKDAIVLMDASVLPGVSLRGYGESKIVEEDGQEIEEVTWLQFTGFDLVLNPGFQEAAVDLLESKTEDDMPAETQTKEKDTSTASPDNGRPLTMEQLREQNPELYESWRKSVAEEAVQEHENARQTEEEREAAEKAKAAEASLRESLGIGPDDDLEEAIAKAKARREELEARETERHVAAHIEESTKDLNYPQYLREQAMAYVQEAEPQTVEEADEVIEKAKKIFGPLAANERLKGMGFSRIEDVAPVIERELNVPAYARPAFELTESMVKAGLWTPREKRSRNRNLIFAEKYLERYDEMFKGQLIREANQWSEAMLQTQLSLPYTVVRAIIDEAFPMLVATSIFDSDVVAANPTRIFYEAFFQGETGYSVDVTNEDVTSDEDAWVDFANKQIVYGTVNVEDDGGGTPYVEGTDYVVDYLEGRIMVLSTGSIGDSTALDVDYTYHAVRKGENAGIERARSGVRFTDLSLTADRLATEISDETIKFSQSQIGYDAVTRTLNLLVKELMRNINSALFGVALAEAQRVANNSAGTWNSASDPETDLVKKIGIAKVKVANRYYEPTFILMSRTNADRVANWDSFTAAGSRPDANLDAAGYVGQLKGLPVFHTTEFPDAYILVGNREHVMYRTFGDMELKGPYPTYDGSGKLVANDQYFLQEYNGRVTPINQKASYVVVS